MIIWLLTQELSLGTYIMFIVFGLVAWLFWFVGIPYLIVKFTRSVSLERFWLKMILYSLIVAALHLFFLYLDCCENYYIVTNTTDVYSEKIFYIASIVLLAVFFVSGIISSCIFMNTNGADVALPKQYRHIKPVKAKVMGIDEKTIVEYNGKSYKMSKNFNFRLRDTIKVRLTEEGENAYLA